MSTLITEAVFPDNCGACGEEYLSSELTPIKLGNISVTRIKICIGCMADNKDVVQDLVDVAEILSIPVDNV
jgi:hypothetical protein